MFDLGNETLVTLTTLLATGAAARVAYGAWSASRQSLPTSPVNMQSEPVDPDEKFDPVKFDAQFSEPVVTQNRLADSDITSFKRTKPSLNPKSEWLNRYNLSLNQFEKTFNRPHPIPNQIREVESETQIRLLPPLSNKKPFQRFDLAKPVYVYNVVIDGQNQLLALPESAHRRLVNIIASEGTEPTDPHDGINIRVKRTSVGNVPHYDFSFEGISKIHENPEEAALLVSNQVALEKCVTQIQQMTRIEPEPIKLSKPLMGREDIKVALDQMPVQSKQAPVIPKGAYVQITDRKQRVHYEDVTGLSIGHNYTAKFACSQSPHSVNPSNHRLVIDGDVGEVVGHCHSKDGENLMIVEIVDHQAPSVECEIEGKFNVNKMYAIMRGDGIKMIPSPVFKVGDISNWLTKAGRESPTPSRVLAVQWNGLEWIYTLHWFQNGRKEIRFFVEQNKMLGVREGVDGLCDYLRQARDYVASVSDLNPKDKDDIKGGRGTDLYDSLSYSDIIRWNRSRQQCEKSNDFTDKPYDFHQVLTGKPSNG